ncbi:E3 ubiquitin-protein ligase SHPRH [Musca domestica]|uniref:E3 ubiquitin-protein ligase SHPRH n=1 Tax=Musca domestica TaxID=7370 RepID=A0A9J7I4X4_MUSDO|nr:E3 ubiquitin-protein ligase SHPRH [Musca domestica]
MATLAKSVNIRMMEVTEEDAVVLSKIAKIYYNAENDNNYFVYKQKSWQLLDVFNNESESLLQIIGKTEKGIVKGLDFVESNDGYHLMVLYRNDSYTNRKNKTTEAIDKLLEILFGTNVNNKTHLAVTSEEDESSNPNEEQRILKTYVTTKLFEALQKCHASFDELQHSEQLILPQKFLPKLCNYQMRSVRWLLAKERCPSTFSPYFQRLTSKDNETVVYKHCFLRYILQNEPGQLTLPPGGILAEEMGLGKTVEMLALILLNPRNDVDVNPGKDLKIQPPESKRKRIEKEVFCTCNSKSKNKILQCTKCNLWQHIKCVAKYNSDHDDDINEPYLCPGCWNTVISQDGLVKTKATFIVSPNTIKLQWLSEIRRHIQPTLRVLLYEGVCNGKWISPRQLANYDVVLTDYNILTREIYFTNENHNERTMRNKPRSIRLKTSTLMVEWYRVCLDEAQMVESNASHVASLVRMLPAINHWAVTGTPIQKSLNDLQPLLDFVGFDSVTEPNTWNYLVNNFVLEHEKHTDDKTLELVKILQKCMWRTWKSLISDELQIPPQHQQVHRIQFDNLEKFFYNEQHDECRTMFMGNVHKYTSRMSTISPQIMKIILMPFLKIRQSCTMPVVVVNSNNNKNQASQQKQFLQPEELHSYLKSTNELSCKSELRAMASVHNGLAALYIIQKKYDHATKHYNSVLKLANEYVNMSVTVDSLLQMHALHNLMEIKRMQHFKKADLEIYQTQYNSLEWKYLGTYSNTLSNVMSSYNAVINKCDNAVNEQLIATMSAGLSQLHINDTSQLLQKIYEDCMPRFGVTNPKLAEIQSSRSLLYIVDLWFAKLNRIMKSIQIEVNELTYFTENVKPRHLVCPTIWTQIMQLLQSVYDCHLSEIREQETKEKRPKGKKILCKMCQIRDLINNFECLLFDKVIDKDTNITEGMQNHSLEMQLCKITFGYLKNKQIDIHLTKTMENNWLYLENLQSLCKRLIKLWIEIEFTIKAYDELDMCKLRITLTDDPDDKSIFKIFEHEVDQRIIDQQNELQLVQRQFTIKLARLKYIKHLESNKELGACPICRLSEEDRYAVLECGHHICFPCLKSMQQYNRSGHFKCSICRNVQHNSDIYYISKSKTIKPENKMVKGNYSSKITYIVRLILSLQNQEVAAGEEKYLKVLIFSQWLPILQAIAAALKENDITFRLQCTPLTLEEFKNPSLNITCLLMPFIKGSKGLNLVEANHVFLVEPILNPGEELQAIGRVHRIGQTRQTTVHRFIMEDSIEENIHDFVSSSGLKDSNTSGIEQKWEFNNVSLDDFDKLFVLKGRH